MNSKQIKDGVSRAPHRSLLKATGLTDSQLKKPIIGIVNSFNEIVPGHIHLQTIARAVKDGVLAAGGVPVEFNTIGVCDGIAMGHEGMKYSSPPGTHRRHHRVHGAAHCFDAGVKLRKSSPVCSWPRRSSEPARHLRLRWAHILHNEGPPHGPQRRV